MRITIKSFLSISATLTFSLGATAESKVPSTKPRVTALLAEGNALYARAAAIVAETPHTSLGGAVLVSGTRGPAGSFYVDDRRYQDELQNVSPIAGDAKGPAFTLVGVEAFLYGAVVASVTQCNEHDARLNLHVARAILDETARELHGHASGDWSPPEITENGQDQCS